MNIAQFEVSVIEYVKQYVISEIPDSFIRFGLLFAVKGILPPYIKKYLPTLEKAEIVSEGKVDIDKLNALLESTFKDIPKFTIADFGFSAEDLPLFITFLKRQNTM